MITSRLGPNMSNRAATDAHRSPELRGEGDGWLAEIAEVLEPDGVIALVVPDKRYCFDHRRPLTQIWDLVDAYLQAPSTPTPRQMYEFASLMAPADTEAIWRGDRGAKAARRTDVEDVDQFAMELCLRWQAGEYVDVHCWTFTPASFVDLWERLAHLGLVDLELADVRPTAWGSLEFHVLLRRPQARPPAHDASIARARRTVATEERPDTSLRRVRRRLRTVAGSGLRALRGRSRHPGS